MVYDPTEGGWSGVSDPVASDPDGAIARRLRVQKRIRLVTAACAGVFALLAGRAAIISLTGERGPLFAAADDSDSERRHRANIVDRNGELLAGVVTTYDLSANTRAVWNPKEMAQKISAILPGVDAERLTKKLQRGGGYILVRRDLSPRQRQAIFNLGMPALEFTESERRFYPRGTLAAHVLGFVGADGVGKAGIEHAYNERIFDLGAKGEPLRLTLDMRVQYALEAELAAATAEFQAKAAAGVVMDVTNGELLGVGSWPVFDPNVPGAAKPSAMRNRAVADVYEMGSTFKPLTVAMGLDAGDFTLADHFDAKEPLAFGPQKIRDAHPLRGEPSVSQIVIQSSNIGTAHMALAIGAVDQQKYLRSFGLLDPSPLQTGDIGRPLLPRNWEPVTVATVGFGHGIAVSPLAITSAFAALANSGVRISPTITVRSPEDPPNMVSVVSPQSARATVSLMRRVVTEGTGKRANVPGYEVAGKTGSAEKVVAGAYDPNKLVSSFAAVFPASEPRYAVLILLDEPKKVGEDGNALAGQTAAPSVGRLIQRVAPILGVAPKLDTPPVGVAIDGEETKRRAG